MSLLNWIACGIAGHLRLKMPSFGMPPLPLPVLRWWHPVLGRDCVSPQRGSWTFRPEAGPGAISALAFCCCLLPRSAAGGACSLLACAAFLGLLWAAGPRAIHSFGPRDLAVPHMEEGTWRLWASATHPTAPGQGWASGSCGHTRGLVPALSFWNFPPPW